MRSIGGFTLVELLIVVLVLMIVATIAIPSLLRSRQTANESAAIAALKTLNTAEVTYSTSAGGYYTTLTELVTNGLADSSLAATKSGYNYAIQLSVNSLDYIITATAASAVQGRYDYYTTTDYVIRFTTITTRAPAGLAGEPAR